MSQIYVCCGSDHFDKDLFRPISNRTRWVKPNGGLWASPEDSSYTWKEWCLDNEFHVEKLAYKFRFKLAENSRVIDISSTEDLIELCKDGRCIPEDTFGLDIHGMYYIDFEKLLSDGIDAIRVTIYPDLYWSLYGWDVDSLLVLNPECIVEI